MVHDKALRDLYQQLLPLLQPGEEIEKPFIGFKIKERPKKYHTKKK